MGALIMTDSFDSSTTQETNSSTKKMSIDSLLSASRNPTESSLIQVKNRLSDISLVLQGHNDVNFDEISSKIVEIFEVSVFKDLSSKDKVLTIQAQYIQLLKRSNPQELQSNGGVFYELEQLSSKVSLLLEERFRLHKDVKNLQDYFKTDNTKLFNVITQDMMNDQTNIPGKRKRLEREKVKILENWYVSICSKCSLK
ncbi:hypothetical protein WICPIJ_004997 [Wickerhamomyces pijperi]|uniref:Uncharacterized protein n=1 Tax=Wickerhamomyces pijperi TaxID=599730 RepID=A0A9P8Q6T3_WICPI|nr:hypothetical protein WICPIJ_004997 [Wickerhamomyces pijperi]